MPKYSRGSIPLRVKGYMLGYYAALQQNKEALIDVPLEDMSPEYLRTLKKKAEIDTEALKGKTFALLYKAVENSEKSRS